MKIFGGGFDVWGEKINFRQLWEIYQSNIFANELFKVTANTKRPNGNIKDLIKMTGGIL